MVWRYLTHGPFSNTTEFKAHYCDQQKPDTRHFVLVSSYVLHYLVCPRIVHKVSICSRVLLKLSLSCRQIAQAVNPSGCSH